MTRFTDKQISLAAEALVTAASNPLTWTPTVTATAPMTISSHTLGYARYFQLGKLVFFWYRGTVTTATTASSTIIITAPVNTINNGLSSPCVATVVIPAVSTAVGRGIVEQSGTNTLRVVRQVSGVDANFTLASGIIIMVSGVYEAA